MAINLFELAAVLLSLIYLFFSIRENPISWIFGFVSSAMYIYVFYQAKFYAEVSLNSYYLFVSVYGWLNWHRKASTSSTDNLPITTITGSKAIAEYLVAIVAVFLVYYFVLTYLTDSTIVVADSTVGALSVVATFMLARKKIENWIVWIVVDAFATILYITKGMYLTSVLYAVFTVMAVVGYRQWLKAMKET